MKKVIILIIILVMAILFSLVVYHLYFKPDPAPLETPRVVEETPPGVDHTGGLLRGDDGILIGSATLDEPILLMGMPFENPDAPINVREEPTLGATRITQIHRGDMVETAEIVDGWYRVTLSVDGSNGYIRSDLLVPYEPGVQFIDTGDIGASIEQQEDQGGSNEFFADDPSGLMRGEDGVLIGSVEFDEPVMLMGMGANPLVIINVREGPSTDAARVGASWGAVQIGKGQKVMAFGVEDGWYRVRVLPGMFEGYIRSDLLVPHDETVQYLVQDTADFDTKMNPDKETITSHTLVDVRGIIPDIEYYMIFATPDNFTEKPQYSRDVPLLQLGTALKLREAQELFKQDGYRIKLYDAYRPSSVSGRLSDIIKDTRYIARAGASMHNRAAAVDITLIDADGNELVMPSPMHTFNSTAHRDSSAMSAEAKANMNYMTGVMKQVGMTGISTEWWHFNDSDADKYLAMDVEFGGFVFLPMPEG